MKKIGRLESRILSALWKSGHATSFEIMDSLPAPVPAYPTLSFSLRALTNQGIITLQRVGKEYRYSPVWTREDLLKYKISEMANDLFSGDQGKLNISLKAILKNGI